MPEDPGPGLKAEGGGVGAGVVFWVTDDGPGVGVGGAPMMGGRPPFPVGLDSSM